MSVEPVDRERLCVPGVLARSDSFTGAKGSPRPDGPFITQSQPHITTSPVFWLLSCWRTSPLWFSGPLSINSACSELMPKENLSKKRVAPPQTLACGDVFKGDLPLPDNCNLFPHRIFWINIRYPAAELSDICRHHS